MDQFKSIWTKMKAKKDADDDQVQPSLEITNEDNNSSCSMSQAQNGISERPVIIKHSQLGPKHPSDLTSMLFDVDTFQSLGKIQPFTVRYDFK